MVEQVKELKRQGNFAGTEHLLIKECDRQEAEAAASGLGVAAWYYEQLAIIYREAGRPDAEINILARYDRQIKAPGIGPTKLKSRLEKARAAANRDKKHR